LGTFPVVFCLHAGSLEMLLHQMATEEVEEVVWINDRDKFLELEKWIKSIVEIHSQIWKNGSDR